MQEIGSTVLRLTPDCSPLRMIQARAVASFEDTTDEELMRAYVAGDHAAFRALFERYAPQLERLTRRHLDSDEEAREVVQATFFRLHGARKDFRDGARLRPWLLTIAMNLVREHWRKRKRQRTGPIEEELASVVQETSERELEERALRVRNAVAELPARHREVVELHWFQELPFAEVASIVGSSEGAVRVRAHRAYARLKAILGGSEVS